MIVNQRTIDLIKEFEGFSSEAYLDKVAKPPVWTIGFGTTAAADVGIKPLEGMKVTKDAAEVYLRRAVEKFAMQVEPGLSIVPNENQFGAFVSLAYNIGPGAFLKSTALRKWNAGDLPGVEAGILMFNKAGGKVVPGLKRRREAEVELFRAEPPQVAEPTPPAGKSWLAALLDLLSKIMKGSKK